MATIDLLDSPRRRLWCALGWGSLVEEDGDTGAVPEAREKRGGWQGESWRGRLCLTLLSDWCTRGLHLPRSGSLYTASETLGTSQNR